MRVCVRMCVCIFGIIVIFDSSPDIWFDDVDESEINGEVGVPPQKKFRKDETTKTVAAELVTGKYTE